MQWPSASVDAAEQQPHNDPAGTEDADDAVNKVVDLNIIVVGRIRHCSCKDIIWELLKMRAAILVTGL